MSHDEQPTTEQLLTTARQQWNFPAAPGNTDDALLYIEYTMRVCACAMRCDDMTEGDRDAVYLLLTKTTTLCRIVNLSHLKG